MTDPLPDPVSDPPPDDLPDPLAHGAGPDPDETVPFDVTSRSTEPAQTEAAQTEAAQADAARSEPVQTESAQTESAQSESAEPDAEPSSQVSERDPESVGAGDRPAAAGTTVDAGATVNAGATPRGIMASFRKPRFTAAGMVIALLVGLLGFALIAQVKSNGSTSTLSSDRPDDLVRILSDLDSRKDRLNTEIANLQSTQRQLNSGAQSNQAALNAASQRAEELGILAGTLPAEGPGILVELRSGTSPLDADIVLDAIEELRGAGAEAMQISGGNGPTVRIIASTWFDDGTGGLIVSGTLLTGTLTITVIGDAQTMQTAFTIPGGVDDSVQRGGGTVVVQQPGTVLVTALAPINPLKYAHPVS
jgi:uncharacterized protein YlxW (UPF0749 family)